MLRGVTRCSAARRVAQQASKKRTSERRRVRRDLPGVGVRPTFRTSRETNDARTRSKFDRSNDRTARRVLLRVLVRALDVTTRKLHHVTYVPTSTNDRTRRVLRCELVSFRGLQVYQTVRRSCVHRARLDNRDTSSNHKINQTCCHEAPSSHRIPGTDDRAPFRVVNVRRSLNPQSRRLAKRSHVSRP